jgi:mono/diheme cytochrome c family protein
VVAIVTVALVSGAMLAACGGDDEEAPATEPATTEAATTEAATTEEATTEEGTTEAGEGAGDAEAGAAVFTEAGCGNCHTLEAAGSTGTVGPNLDDAQPSLDLVIERVTNGAPPMPAFGRDGVLDEQQIQDVAAYVVESTSS